MDYSCFKDQTVVITAGGGDLGGSTAVDMARWGARVALIDIHEGRLKGVVKRCQEAGAPKSKIFERVGDCTKEGDVKSFIDATVSKFGGINILLNIVGTKRMVSFQQCTLTDLEYCMEGNIKAIFMVTKACLPHLLQSKGTIVNMSSVSGQRPAWAACPYTTVKAAIDQFTRSIATELAPQGIRCNAVSPAAVMSDFMMRFGDIFTTKEQLDKYMEVAKYSLPIGRVGTIDDVVRAILFLASDKTPFMTGAILPLCGAYSNTSYCP